MASDDKGSVLSGDIISIIDSASVLAIISMGMTLVTAACGGQDISVGAVGAIAGAFFVIMMHPQHEEQLSTLSSVAWPNVILGIIAAIIAAIVFMLFNGTLVAYFKIQPMIATLILFSCGRSIAYYFLFQVLGVGSIKLDDPIIFAMGKVIPGVPIPTSIFIVILMGLLMWLVFKRTNLRLYTQAVGINQKAAQLNGINPTAVKLLSFVMLGVCVAVAAIVKCSNLGTLTTKSLMDSIEMDAILAVAIGGNNLGGGKFRLGGSILGAYTIQTLSTTLNAMQVSPDSMKAYKAIVIIAIMIAGSPVVRNWLVSVSGRIRMALRSSQAKEVE
jgi:simple sugar transport system permease protein